MVRAVEDFRTYTAYTVGASLFTISYHLGILRRHAQLQFPAFSYGAGGGARLIETLGRLSM